MEPEIPNAVQRHPPPVRLPARAPGLCRVDPEADRRLDNQSLSLDQGFGRFLIIKLVGESESPIFIWRPSRLAGADSGVVG